MPNAKPWYLSKTIWASIITMLMSAGGLFGLSIDGIDKPALAEARLQVVTAVSGLVAIVGRILAKDRIG